MHKIPMWSYHCKNHGAYIYIFSKGSELCREDDSVTQQYAHFIMANEAAADALVPLKKKRKQRRKANDPRICQARDNVQCAFDNFQRTATTDAQQKLQEEKSRLKEMYKQQD